MRPNSPSQRFQSLSPAADASDLPLPPLKILLAEDGKANQKMAIGLLTKWGHELTVAENGQEALQRWQDQSFDVILMDVQMPILDGLDATRQIRESERERGERIPIVAMTARAMKGDREQCLAAGMDDYVSKPIRMPELYRALKQCCGKIEDAASSPDEPDAAVDWQAALKSMGGDRELLCVVVDTARREVADLAGQLDAALADQDANTAHRLAHTIKGASRAVMATRTEKVAAAMEESAANNDLESVARQMPLLRETIDQFVRECEEFLGGPG